MDNIIKDYILKMQDEINLNQWKKFFFTFEKEYYGLDLFHYQRELVKTLRDASIDIDNYINDVFDDYEYKCKSIGNLYNDIKNTTKTVFTLPQNFENFDNLTYSDICDWLEKNHSKMHNNSAFLNDIIVDKEIDPQTFKINSYIIANTDIFYLGYCFNILDGNEILATLLISDDDFGRCIDGYGFGYNKWVKEDYDELLINKMSSLGLELK